MNVAHAATRRDPRPALSFLLVAALGLVFAAPAQVLGQVTTNPRIVEFSPSTDHSATLGDGSAAVARYDFELYLAGATAPFHTVNLGKPSPGTDGMIRVDFSTMVASWPLPGGNYESKVSAVGPAGTGRSTASNQFTFVTCSYTLSTITPSVGAQSGSTNIAMTAPAGCAWTVSTSTSWIHLITTSGNGGGSISFSYDTNPTTSQRTGTFTVAGQTVTVTQAGATCNYSVSPTTLTLGSAASSAGTVTITPTPSSCTWTPSTSTSWLTLSTSGTTLTVTASSANTSSQSRSGTVSVAGQTISVTQNGVPCTYSVSPTSVSLTASASTSNSVNVTAPAGCAWTPTTSTSWVTLRTSSGSGNGTLTFDAAANTATSQRSGSITVGGQTIGITQAGVPCTYSLTPSTQSVGSPASSGSFTMNTQAGCTWSASTSTPWISLTTTSGSGAGSVSFSYGANSAGTSRTGSITAGGQTFSLVQGGHPAPAAPQSVRVVTSAP